MTREEAINALRCLITMPGFTANEALDVAIAALKEPTVTNCHQLNGWISVKDKLPEELPEYKDRKVIPCIVHLASCYPNGKGNTQKRQRQQVTDYDGKPCGWEWSRIGKSRVTHWMPLPEPPEVEG